MMRSFFSAISGLRNHQVAMDVIGNNLANVNTIGFKAGRTTFVDALSQTLAGSTAGSATLGSQNPKQIGLGMKIATIDTLFSQGNIQSTSKNTDLAIEGEGFFMVNENDTTYYTRSGNFNIDSAGNLVFPGSGGIVQGWLNTSPLSTIGTTSAISGGSTSTSAPAIAGNNPRAVGATYTFTVETGGTRGTDAMEVRWRESVSGATGTIALPSTYAGGALTVETVGANTLTVAFGAGTLTAGNTFTYTQSTALAAAPIGGDVSAWTLNQTATPTVGGIYTGTATKTYTFAVSEGGTIPPPSGTTVDISWSDGVAASGVVTVPSSYTAGTALDVAEGLTISLAAGRLSTNGTFSVSATASQINNTGTPVNINLDGYDVSADGLIGNGFGGLLTSVLVDTNGTITGAFDDGTSFQLAQVALAVFSNQAGLTKAGDSRYTANSGSGVAQVGVAKTGGRGSILTASLEMSNVDLSSEFTNMIITQRGFQSNARTITTSDEMLQELLQLKR
ncbi:MAG: flagellar hook-basal body complex protein [Nitrospirota bacterium]|nr:flagellar hook-basal body complex protein [Nitrospirota bacterium]